MKQLLITLFISIGLTTNINAQQYADKDFQHNVNPKQIKKWIEDIQNIKLKNETLELKMNIFTDQDIMAKITTNHLRAIHMGTTTKKTNTEIFTISIDSVGLVTGKGDGN